MTDYNHRWDKRDEDEEPRWLPFLAVMALSSIIVLGGAIANLGLAGIHKIRGWA